MRYLRSLALCALAMCASVVMTMPASAFAPIDTGLHAVAAPGVELPAPMIDNALHAVVFLDVSPAAGLSTAADSASTIASTTHLLAATSAGAATPLVEHRMRC